MAVVWIELTGNEGGNFGISQEDSEAEVTYLIRGRNEASAPTTIELSDFVDGFCGSVSNLEPALISRGTGTEWAGKILRVLPPVHPLRPELSAAAVVSLAPATERHEVLPAVKVLGLTSASNTWPSAMVWRAKVKYIKRPYFLLHDQKIAVERVMYYTPDGTGLAVYVAQEWRRFTKTIRKPTPDTVRATFGEMKFRTQAGIGPPGGINDSQYTGESYMYLGNQTIEVMWYQVPYRYMLDFQFGSTIKRSYLTRFVNTVNQADWWGYPAGSLLFLGAEPDSYVPVTPKRQKLLKALGVGLDQGLLMNVRLRFLYTSRVGTDVPNSSHALRTNKNNVLAGHNLLPSHSDRRFYYVAGPGATDAVKMASFQSFRFELFFTDPLLENGDV